MMKNRPCKIFGRQLLKNLKRSRPYRFKFFKVCLPQILHGLFLNTLSYLRVGAFRTIFAKSSIIDVYLVLKSPLDNENCFCMVIITKFYLIEKHLKDRKKKKTKWERKCSSSNRRLLNHVLSLYHGIAFSSMSTDSSISDTFW